MVQWLYGSEFLAIKFHHRADMAENMDDGLHPSQKICTLATFRELLVTR